MAARPFKLFGARERALVAGVLEERVAAWAAAWLPGPAAPRVQCAPAVESRAWQRAPEAATWSACVGAGESAFSCAAADADLAELARALCGSRPGARVAGGSEIAREAAARALEDLCVVGLGAPVAKTLHGAAAAPGPQTGARGSACYAAELALGEGRIALLASAEW